MLRFIESTQRVLTMQDLEVSLTAPKIKSGHRLFRLITRLPFSETICFLGYIYINTDILNRHQASVFAAKTIWTFDLSIKYGTVLFTSETVLNFEYLTRRWHDNCLSSYKKGNVQIIHILPIIPRFLDLICHVTIKLSAWTNAIWRDN